MGFNSDKGAGVEDWLGSAGVPITSKTGPGSGSAVGRTELEDELGWGVRPLGARSVPELDFAFESFSSRGRFKFKLVEGPGVLCFEPDVTGRDLVFFFLIVAIEDRGSSTWDRMWMRERGLGAHGQASLEPRHRVRSEFLTATGGSLRAAASMALHLVPSSDRQICLSSASSKNTSFCQPCYYMRSGLSPLASFACEHRVYRMVCTNAADFHHVSKSKSQ